MKQSKNLLISGTAVLLIAMSGNVYSQGFDKSDYSEQEERARAQSEAERDHEQNMPVVTTQEVGQEKNETNSVENESTKATEEDEKELAYAEDSISECKKYGDFSNVEAEFEIAEQKLLTSKAIDHMDTAEEHIKAGKACARGAIFPEKEEYLTSCKTVANFGIASFSKETSKRVNKFKRMACRHLYATKTAEERAYQAYNHIQGENEWKRGEATRSYSTLISAPRSPSEGLLGLTSTFIKTSGVSENDLQNCVDEEGITVESAYSEFKKELYGESWSPISIVSPRGCNNGEDALFKSSYDSGNQNWSFFANFSKEGIGALNRNKLCKDHATKACFKNLLFKSSCEEMDEGDEKKLCEFYANKGLASCLRGEYATAYYPKIINDYIENKKDPETGRVKVSPSDLLSSLKEVISGFHTTLHTNTGSQTCGEELFMMSNGAEKEGLNMVANDETNKFNRFFDVAYGTCVYMRAAAQKAAKIGGTPGGLQIGEVIQGGRYSCKRVAPWTADFNDCAFKMLYGDGMFDAAAVFGGAGIQVKTAMDQGSTMKKQSSEMAAGSPTAALNAQKRNLKNQAENQYIQGGMAGSHAMALTISAADFPTAEKLSTACDQPLAKSHFKDEVVNCGVAVVVDRMPSLGPEVFANQEVKEALYYKGAEKMMESALATLTGLQLDKQANDVERIKGEYDKFFQEDVAMPTYEPVNYCEQNPSAPSCSGGNRVSDSGTEFGNIGFQNSGGGNFSFNNGVQDGYNPDEKLTQAEKEARDRLGDIMVGDGKKGNNDFKKVGEASGSSASRVSGGGGGGGAGGGGGGSTAAAPKKADSKGPNNYGMQKSNTKRTEGGSVNYRSGGSVAKNKKKNAFDGLLDRNRRRDVATTTLDDIAPKKSKLFEKISKRYNQVSADKRLYEFESEQ